MGRVEQILQALAQAEVAIQQAKELVGTPKHKDGPFEASKARVTFPARAVPEIGGKVTPRPYFTAGPKLPDSLKPLYAKYARATWGDLFSAAKAGDASALDYITKDRF